MPVLHEESQKEMEMFKSKSKRSSSLKPQIESVQIDSRDPKDIAAGKIAVMMKAAGAFKAAGERSEARRTGTSLAREGTGMHATLTRIRSKKGRATHEKFVKKEESGVLVRPTDVKFLFSEEDNFKKVWTVLILALVVFTSIVIPIQFGFPEGMEESPGLDYTIDVLFILDLFICFRTAYINNAGDEVYDTKMIASNYIKNWFAIDLVACFPAEVFVLLTNAKDSRSKILLRLLKMPRLLRIGRLFKYLNEFKYAAAWRVIKLVVMLMFVSHWIACLYNMVCRLEFDSNLEVWEPFTDYLTSSFGEQYMFALLTAFSVLIGEGIDPQSTAEQAFIFCAAVLGAVLMAVIIGNISLVLQNGNALSALHRNKMDMINDAMRAMDISPRLQKKTVMYYELLWTRQRALSTKSSFIDELSPPLRKEVNLDLNTEVIYRCELFKNLLDRSGTSLEATMSEETSDHVLVAIVNALEREVYLPGDTIIQQGEIGNEMYFLVRGLISIEKMGLNEETNVYCSTEIAKLKAGSYFGELALLRDGDRSKQRRAASCISLTDSDTRILRKSIFNQVCEDFPELRTYLQAEANRKYAAFAPAPSKVEEVESKSEKSPSKMKRFNSITAALTKKNVEITGSPTSIQKAASGSNLDNLNMSKEAWGTAPTATLATIQTTLNAINLRMSRLEENMGRLQQSSFSSNGRGDGKGSNGRKYTTSPRSNSTTSGGGTSTGTSSFSSSGKRGPRQPSTISKGVKGWANVRNIVQPEAIITSFDRDDEDNKSNSSVTKSRGTYSPTSNGSTKRGNERNRPSPSNSRWSNGAFASGGDDRKREEDQHTSKKKLSNRRWG